LFQRIEKILYLPSDPRCSEEGSFKGTGGPGEAVALYRPPSPIGKASRFSRSVFRPLIIKATRELALVFVGWTFAALREGFLQKTAKKTKNSTTD